MSNKWKKAYKQLKAENAHLWRALLARSTDTPTADMMDELRADMDDDLALLTALDDQVEELAARVEKLEKKLHPPAITTYPPVTFDGIEWIQQKRGGEIYISDNLATTAAGPYENEGSPT